MDKAKSFKFLEDRSYAGKISRMGLGSKWDLKVYKREQKNKSLIIFIKYFKKNNETVKFIYIKI